MSWLRITHETAYHYSRPVEMGLHRLVLRPREGHDLRVESFGLTIGCESHVEWSRDIFGNSIALVEFEKPTDMLRIESNVLVWRTPSPGHSSTGEQAVWPAVYDDMEKIVAEAYTRPVYPEDCGLVKAWLEEPGWKKTETVESALEQISRRIHTDIRYTRRDESGVFPPAKTLAGRTGSCRDMATLFLETARALGIAVRFASGYLECEAADVGEASTHAWIEAYVPGRGWRGYDPSSGERTSHKHIVTGVSNHPRGVMPVSGHFFGEREDYLGMTVSVRMEHPVRSAPAGFPESSRLSD
ncbi:MAG TPA: transglutaminase family protein [Rariglobus sp.]